MILITGGTAYIGSHACVALVEAGFDVLLLDNLANSEASGVDRLEAICGTRPGSVDGDNRDGVQLIRTFESSNGRGVPLDVGAGRQPGVRLESGQVESRDARPEVCRSGHVARVRAAGMMA